MSNSTTSIDQISQSQAQKEVTANAAFDASWPAMTFARRASTSAALTWGYYGGNILVGGTPTQIINGTIALTASATNYLYSTAAGVVTKTTSPPSGWPGPLAAGAFALYEIVTGTDSATSWIDYRSGVTSQAVFTGDSGSGGVAGLVPAPATGDAALGKVLNANGTWGLPSIPIGTFNTGMQGFLGSRVYALWTPLGNGQDDYGGQTSTLTGTSTTGATQTTADVYTQNRRLILTSGVGANSQAGQHWANYRIWRGNSATLGGFIFSSRMGADAWSANGRWAVGLWGTNTLPGTTADPSTLVNSILIGQDAGDTNIQIMSHDATTGSTKATLGASFPTPTPSVSWYEFRLYSQPNASTIQYYIANLTTGAVGYGDVSLTLPANNAFLYAFRYSNNGAAGGSVDLNLGNAYIETNY